MLDKFSYSAVQILLLIASCLAHQNVSLPLQLSAVKTSSVNGTCPSATLRGAIRQNLQNQVSSLLRDRVVPILRSRPPCACGGPGEWTRIAHLNMSDPNESCPANWNLMSTPVRGCGRSSACNSAIFPSNGTSYSRVCGRVNAYEKGTPDAFARSISSNPGVEGAYIDGVSLTHGAAGSRQHIWSFVAAFFENSSPSGLVCRCTNINLAWPYQVPAFVGNNYFCDTGNPGPGYVLKREFNHSIKGKIR